MKISLKTSASIVGIVCFTALLGISLGVRSTLLPLFSQLSYWIMWAILLFWLVKSWELKTELQLSLRDCLREYWVGITFSLALAGLIFFSVRPGFRTLSDETNLLAVSKSFLFEHTPFNTTMGKFYYENFNPMNREVPTRPFMFPFFTYLIHTLLGFHRQNVFVLNFFFLWSLLAGVFIFVRRWAEPLVAAAAVLLVCSYPLFAVYGTGGGFDLCSTVWFGISMAALGLFLSKPSAPAFGFLWASLVLYTQIRYESIVVFGIVIGALAAGRHIRKEWVMGNLFTLLATPLLFLPFFWQRILTEGHYENPPGVPLFSVGRFLEHFWDLIKSLHPFNWKIPYANLLTWVSLVLAILLVRSGWRKWLIWPAPRRMFFGILAACLLVLNILFLAHHFGVYGHPTQARFYMLLSLIFALLPVAAHLAWPEWVSARRIFILSFLMFFVYHPLAVEGRYINALVLDRETDFSLAFLDRKNNPHILIVNNRPGQFTAINYGAVNFGYANTNSSAVLNDLKRHLVQDVIVFQRIEYSTGKPLADWQLDPVYRLETLEEYQITANEFLRISKVIPPV